VAHALSDSTTGRLADVRENAVASCNELGHERRSELETVRSRGATDMNNAKDEIGSHLRRLNLDDLLGLIRRLRTHDHRARQQMIELILAELKWRNSA
jgi:hypothetical protein